MECLNPGRRRIGRLPQTLADRRIAFTMQRKLPAERCHRLRDLDAPALRRKCARLVQDNAEAAGGKAAGEAVTVKG